MQKLRNSNIAKMIAAKITNKEIDFLIYISRFQDDNGKVYGIHYKELCETMHMSYQEFYNVKLSLEEKGFIKCEKSHRIDHDITILDNSDSDCRQNGYVNTNHNIFFLEKFFQFKAGTKLLALELMKITYSGKGYFEIGVKKFYEKYMALFQVSQRVIRSYLKELREFFSIGIKNKKYYIEPRKIIYRKTGEKSEAERLREHLLEAVLRRNRIHETDARKKRDVKELFQQYGAKAIEEGKNLFALMNRAVERSIDTLNAGKKTQEKRYLSVALIHKLLKEEWSVPGQNVPLFQTNGDLKRQYNYDGLEKVLLGTMPAIG